MNLLTPLEVMQVKFLTDLRCTFRSLAARPAFTLIGAFTLALGIGANNIYQLVVRQGMWLTLLGITIGLAAAFGLSQYLTSLLFEVAPLDRLTWGGAVAALLLVAGLACTIPAWRAIRIDPVQALRHQ